MVDTHWELSDSIFGMEQWRSVSDIPDFPFDSFDQLREAVARRSYNLGVDPLAAAQWADEFNTRLKRITVAVLSLLLILAAITSVIVAVSISNYWLLAAPLIMAITFYLSNPAFPLHKWVTVLGVLSVAATLNLLANGLPTATLLLAYAGLTFAAVRAAAFISNSAFRKALLSDEALFLAAFSARACSLRNTRTKRVHCKQ
jgi:hypothetical protein